MEQGDSLNNKLKEFSFYLMVQLIKLMSDERYEYSLKQFSTLTYPISIQYFLTKQVIITLLRLDNFVKHSGF